MLTQSSLGQATTRVSTSSAAEEGDGKSIRPSISSDGRYVAFESTASNLVPDDTNGVDDIFVHDRQTDVTVRVSVSSSGAQADDKSGRPSISDDGRFVAFYSDASNLAAGDSPVFDLLACPACTGTRDVFVHDRDPDENGAFDGGNGTTAHVSVSSQGSPGDNESTRPSISGDGRYVAFRSGATNLVDGDTNGVNDVFVHDVQTGDTVRASQSAAGEEGNAKSDRPAISADGRFVAFFSDADNLVPGDTNGLRDVFVYDLQTDDVVRASVASGGGEADGESSRPAVSTDGRFIAFRSAAANLVDGDTNLVEDVFIHDRDPDENGVFDEGNGVTDLVSAGLNGSADGASSDPSISGDGRYVAFHSDAANLVEDDRNTEQDVFVLDRQTDELVRISVCGGATEGDNYSERPSISDDGRFAAFASRATNLVVEDTNATRDIFVRDLILAGDSDECPVMSPATRARSACGAVGMAFFALTVSGLMALRRRR